LLLACLTALPARRASNSSQLVIFKMTNQKFLCAENATLCTVLALMEISGHYISFYFAIDAVQVIGFEQQFDN